MANIPSIEPPHGNIVVGGPGVTSGKMAQLWQRLWTQYRLLVLAVPGAVIVVGALLVFGLHSGKPTQTASSPRIQQQTAHRDAESVQSGDSAQNSSSKPDDKKTTKDTPSSSGNGSTGTSSGASGGSSGSSSGGGTSGGSGGTGGGSSPVSGWPAAYNTGYPHGLAGDTRTPVTLTPYSGPCTITAANTVINAKDITCRIVVRAANVTIKNSRIRVSNENAIYIDDVYHAIIMDTELDGQHADNSAGGISLIGDGSYTLVRVDAHGSGDIARINWGGVAIVDSYLHDPYCLQGSCHNDVTQSTDSNCTLGVDSINGTIGSTSDATGGQWCVKLVHNTMENPNTQTSNILLKADQGAIHDVLVENNLFNGGGYTVYWYDANYQISNGTIRNNRFRRAAGGGYWPNGGYFGPIASNVNDSSRWPTWTNNVWDDNGAQISF